MNAELTTAIVQVVVALLGVMTILISSYLTPWVREWLAARTREAQAAGHGLEVSVLTGLATQAVLAIEQQIDRYTSNGERRTAAVDWLVTQGLARGVSLNRDDAAQLIEAAVRTMKATGLAQRSQPGERVAVTSVSTGTTWLAGVTGSETSLPGNI